MSSQRRRSRTIDLSNMTANQIQKAHDDFTKEDENNIHNDENIDAAQTQPNLSPRQKTPSKSQSVRRRSNRRVSFADEMQICEFDKDGNVASAKNSQSPQHQECEVVEKVKVDKEILEVVVKHFVGCLTSYSYASKSELRSDLEKVRQKVSEMLKSVLSTKSNNSLLLYGNPGSGKRLVVENAVQEILGREEEEEQNVLGVVRLSGFLHNDEAAAFKEIAKQLCKQFGLEYQRLVTQAENLEFFKNILQEISRVNRGVVFILWNLEKFAEKGKQGLLYNLYDVLQDSKVQACVVGLTCQLDIDEKFEKRIRSRMAMQKIFVTTPTSTQAIQEVLKCMLSANESVIEMLSQNNPRDVQSYVKKWNRSLEQTLQLQKVVQRLQVIGQCGYTVKHMAKIALTALMNLEPDNATITGDVLIEAADEVVNLDRNWKNVIGGLTEAECLMLVSVCRLFKRDKLGVNFEMAFLEYQKSRQQAGQGILLSRMQAFLSFRNLIQYGIFKSVVGQQKVYQSLLQEYELVHLNVNPDEVILGLKLNENCSVELVQWVRNDVVANVAQDITL